MKRSYWIILCLYLASCAQLPKMQGPIGQLNNVSVNGVYNAKDPAFGAKADGSDDYNALQAAILGACNISSLGQTPPSTGESALYIPAGTYSYSQPLRIPCGSIDFSGAGERQTTLAQSYIGPALLNEPYGANNLNLTSALLTGTGQAVINQNTGGTLFLSDIIGPLAANKMDGLPTFDIEFTFKPSATPTNGFNFDILESHPTNVSASGAKAAWRFLSDNAGTGALSATADIGGSLIIVPASSPPTLMNGTTYDVALDYDGCNMRLFVGTPGNTLTMYGPVAATGSLVQEPFNVSEVPDIASTNWPDDGNLGINPWQGTIDSIRISNISRHTSPYTGPTAKLPSDINTLYLQNFVTTGYVADGLQSAQVQNGTIEYQAVRGVAGGYENPQQHIHDFRVNGPYNATWTWESKTERVLAEVDGGFPQEVAGINFYGGNFTSSRRDLDASGFHIGIEYAGDGESEENNTHEALIGRGVCTVNAGGGGEDIQHDTCTGNQNIYYGWISYGSFLNLSFPFDDVESANNIMRGVFWLNDTSDNISLPQLTNGNNAPFFVIAGGAGSQTIINPWLLGAAAEDVDILTPPAVPVQLIGGTDGGGHPLDSLSATNPVSNNMAWVTTSGQYYTSASTTFANLGTPRSNGATRYCSDCALANPCAGGGTGAIAKYLNGGWICN